MKDFKSYVQSSNVEKEGQNNMPMDTQTAEELTKKIASAYNGASNLEMLKNIFLEAEKSKRAGTLSNQEIETFYENFAPLLNGFQRKKLREIVDKLKQI